MAKRKSLAEKVKDVVSPKRKRKAPARTSPAETAAAPKDTTNYAKLHGPALTDALGRDPAKWATACAQQASIIQGGHMTHGYLKDWFERALAT